ncbi:MAG: Integrase/recombinase [Thermodesulfobacteria bacterium]|nr:tyrosine-type recombinase/integrase [Thermodesulfobacteriota bacterium]MCU4137436.1 Integrase/recombinase [Thermodesulfobacteriota bacterium]
MPINEIKIFYLLNYVRAIKNLHLLQKHLLAITNPKELAGILRMIWSYPYSPIVAGALKMLVYTFQRPGEVRNMKWKDIDWERKEWRFIAYKIKKEHIVPLSRQVMEILEELKPLTGHSPYVFMGNLME